MVSSRVGCACYFVLFKLSFNLLETQYLSIKNCLFKEYEKLKEYKEFKEYNSTFLFLYVTEHNAEKYIIQREEQAFIRIFHEEKTCKSPIEFVQKNRKITEATHELWIHDQENGKLYTKIQRVRLRFS